MIIIVHFHFMLIIPEMYFFLRQNLNKIDADVFKIWSLIITSCANFLFLTDNFMLRNNYSKN